MDNLETLIISENTVLQSMVSTELKETTKSMVSGCGEEQKSPWNGKIIQAMITSLSTRWILKIRLIKNLPKNIGSILRKIKLSRENQSLMLIGSSEKVIVICKQSFVNSYCKQLSHRTYLLTIFALLR